MNTLIQNALVITLDQQGRIFDCADILITGDTIYYVGEKANLPTTAIHQVIDAKGKIAMPGYHNAHTHLPMVLFRGISDGLPLMEWLGKIQPMEKELDFDAMYYGAMLGIAEMLRGGTVSFNDMYFLPDAIGQAMEETGIKGVITCCAACGEEDPQRIRSELENAVNCIQKWNNQAEGRIQTSVAPHAEYTCCESLLRGCAEIAGEYDVLLHTHVSETRREHEECIGRHGLTPTQYLDSLGVLDHPAIIAHGVYLTEEDRAILKEKGTAVSLCPTSNLKLNSGVADAGALLDAGILACIGTDGAASNDDLSMIGEANLAALLYRKRDERAPMLGAAACLQMATVNGAKAMGFDHSGRIAEGYRADIILVDTQSSHMQPIHDAQNNIVYASTAQDVYLTMVDGRVLYCDGTYTTLDYDKVLAGAQRAAAQFSR